MSRTRNRSLLWGGGCTLLAAAFAAATLPVAARAQTAAAARPSTPNTLHPTPSPHETPPPPAPPKPLVIPAVAEKTLPNGVRVIVARRSGTGIVSVDLLMPHAGGAADPTDRAGLANMTASLLSKGTATRTAPQIASAIETLGGSLTAGAGWDATTINLTVMRANLDAALPLMADTVLHPTFPSAELERERSQTLDALAVDLQEPGTLARYAAARVLFGNGPYGHPLGGTPESLKRITRAEIQHFFLSGYRPQGAILVFGGDITAADAYARAGRFFGGWRAAAGAAAPAPAAFPGAAFRQPASPRRIVVIDKPDAGQAAVEITRLGIARRDPDYYVAQVANAVLGGGYSSRLNEEIRVKRGLSYGAGSGIDARLLPGPFVASAQTRNESSPEVAALLLGELGKLATGPLPAAELTPRKLTLIGNFNRSVETGAGLGSAAARLALYGVPLSALSQFPDRVRSVTAADVKRFVGRRLGVRDADLVVVGNASRFLPALKKQFPGASIQVIPITKVRFDSAALGTP